MSIDEELSIILDERDKLKQRAIALGLRVKKRVKLENEYALSAEEAESLLQQSEWDPDKAIAVFSQKEQSARQTTKRTEATDE